MGGKDIKNKVGENRMREIWILGSYPPPYGGVATFVKNLHDINIL